MKTVPALHFFCGSSDKRSPNATGDVPAESKAENCLKDEDRAALGEMSSVAVRMSHWVIEANSGDCRLST
jgi:hypothetical protein